MPKKTTILIAILALFTVILVFFAVKESQPKTVSESLPQTVTLPTEKPVVKTAILSFSPQSLNLSTISIPTPADIVLDTGGSEVTGVQIELTFDPKSVTNLKITPSPDSILGPDALILLNEVDLVNGRVSFAAAVAPQKKSVKGTGKVANLVIQKAFGTDATLVQITFLDKSMVASPLSSESILLSTTPLSVVLNATPTTSVPRVTVPVTQAPTGN